jgi:CheY-like chemotaxis protein
MVLAAPGGIPVPHVQPDHPTILVVEDDPDTRETLCEVLESNGYTPSGASNGAEALDQLRSQPHPSLIVLDMMMPTMDAHGFRREQLADPSLRDIPVILVSGQEDVQQVAAALRIAAFMRKPVQLQPLLALIRHHAAAS